MIFKKGDLVTSRTDGKKMVVISETQGKCKCAWTTNDGIQAEGIFDSILLENTNHTFDKTYGNEKLYS